MLGASACSGPAFRMPTLPVFAALARNPSVPTGESITGAVPNGVTEVQAAREMRLRRDAVLAVGPINVGERDLSMALLQRLLARHSTRVMDLSLSGSLRANGVFNRGETNVTLSGPWGALVWAARWGDATMLLLSEAVEIERVPDPRQSRLRYDPAVLATYAQERDRRVAECEGRMPRIESERQRLDTEFRAAREEYERTRTWLDRLSRDTEGERARQQVQDALSSLETQQGICGTALRQLPSADVLSGRAAAQNDQVARTMSQARATFRVIGLPGGELLWTATLVRRGDDEAQAVGNLLDAVVDTLNGNTRTPTIGDEAPAPPPPAGAPPSRRTPRHPHHRRH
jgi:hypothetical protein